MEASLNKCQNQRPLEINDPKPDGLIASRREHKRTLLLCLTIERQDYKHSLFPFGDSCAKSTRVRYYEHSHFPLGDSRAKRTRERARRSPATLQTNSVLARVFFSVDCPWAERENARFLSSDRYRWRSLRITNITVDLCFLLPHKPRYWNLFPLGLLTIAWSFVIGYLELDYLEVGSLAILGDLLYFHRVA